MAGDCSRQWDHDLNTEPDPVRPKGYAGDTAAAYGLFAYLGRPRVRLVMKGKFPDARFMSFQSYRGRLQHSVDGLIDTDIKPDAADATRYTIELTPFRRSTARADSRNVITLPSSRIVSIFYRVYAPKNPITLADLPRVEAFDEDDSPTACPRYVHLPDTLDVPELLADLIVQEEDEVTFRVKALSTGTNLGIKGYCWSASEIEIGRVVVITFKAPRVTPFSPQPSDQVRYYSICSMHWPSLTALNGLPDYQAKPDANGIVTLVYGGDCEVKKHAIDEGFNYLPDRRAPHQRILGFNYRNLLPTDEFAEDDMYQREYLPSAVVCTKEEFLNNTKSWTL